jgi:hypothetical protein
VKIGWLLAFICFCGSSCGYRLEEEELEDVGRISISVPFVKGDVDGQLTNAIVRELASTGSFRYVRDGGRYILLATVVQDHKEKIGYRYDREPKGKLEKNLVPTEGRRILGAQVSIQETRTGKILLGPTIVKASIEYDYVNSDNLADLTFFSPAGQRLTVLNFSLGQLDSIEGAEDNALDPLYRHMAQKIIDGLMGQKWWVND